MVDVEEKMTGDMWHGDFTVKYVEDITQKSGSFKKFAIFVKMLLTAAKNQSVDQQNMSSAGNEPQVSLNLLSQQDLQ